MCTIQSFLDAMTPRCRLHVLDDHSSDDDVAMIRRILAKAPGRAEFVPLDVTGNGASLEACFHYARKKKFDLIYFCEDDYWHLPGALVRMLEFHDHFGYDCIIHPTDYTDRYTRPPYESLIFLGKDRHWRTIRHTTGTFMVSRRILEAHWGQYMKFSAYNKKGYGGEDDSINKIYKKEICVSPIPSLAAHISPEPALPPYVDWAALHQSLIVKIE